jgi:NAD(P)-dependent dehydrogenase (short-subunit alcohol dehydrogenase family)
MDMLLEGIGMLLKNKVAIITGAGTGIGEAIAHRFAREGARLVLAGLPSDPVQDVADAIASAGVVPQCTLAIWPRRQRRSPAWNWPSNVSARSTFS